MKLRKGKFGLTMMAEGYERVRLGHIEMVDGLIDDKHGIGYHEAYPDEWRATDVATGIMVADNADLKSTVEKVRSRWDELQKFRVTDQYRNIVKKVDKLRSMPGMKVRPRT